jgi:hypothetical protein
MATPEIAYEPRSSGPTQLVAFRDWCGEMTEFPRTAEQRLGHTIGTEVERAIVGAIRSNSDER